MNRIRTVSQPQSTRTLLAAFGCIIVALLAYAPSARAATTVEQLDQVEAILLDLADTVSAMMDGEGEVLSASSTAPVPVRPVCRLSTNKKVYTAGQDIIVGWKSINTEYVEFVLDGGKNLGFPTEKLDPIDEIGVVANYAGIHPITVRAVSETGHSVTCTKFVAINHSDAVSVDKEVSKLQVQKAQLYARSEKLSTQREKINSQLLQIQIEALMLEIRLQQLLGSESTLTTPAVEFRDESTTLSVNSDATEADNGGEFVVEFDVVAVDTDMYIAKTAARGAQAAGVNYRIVGPDSKAVGTGTTTASLSSSANTEGAYYVVEEGEAESFTLTVSYDPKVSGFYKMGLLRVNWNDTAAVADQKLAASPVANFQTDALNI